MSLPHPSITKIPNTEPDAVPTLWNGTYDEIDENFAALDARSAGTQDELTAARGGAANLDARFDQLEANLAEAAEEALDGALDLVQQGGVFTIANRGVVSGCVASKSTTATRNINLSGGYCFAKGRSFAVADSTNAASVPSNAGPGSATAYIYLFQGADGIWRAAVTPIGTAVPADAITIYSVTIPAGNTDATDPNLASVTLTDMRRNEALFPDLMDNAPVVSVLFSTPMASSDYLITFDTVSAVGAPCDEKDVLVFSRATNGFSVQLASAADSAVVRWKANKLTH
jgi:hypothetical protein